MVAGACRQADAPRAPPAPPPAPSGGSSGSKAAPSAELIREAVLACISAPALMVRQGCTTSGAAQAPVVACADFSPVGSPDVDVLSVFVAQGRYDFARTLGVPSIQATLDAGTPAGKAMLQTYRDFEGPHFEPLADGRQIALEARGLMLGGVVHWATLASPKATFTTVLVRQIPLHDAPLADADRAAVEGWNLTTILACIDERFWPE
jgi:hypothetical protein